MNRNTATNDTGTYADILVDLSTPEEARAWFREYNKHHNKQVDLKPLVARAERFARDVLAAYTDADGKTLKPTLDYNRSAVRAKGNAVPQNVARQVRYASLLVTYARILRQSVKDGDAKNAAVYGFFIGQGFEALRVCQVEHNPARGRKTGPTAGRKGGLERGAKFRPEYEQYQKALDKLAQKKARLSHSALCKELAPRFGRHWSTIYKHTNMPPK